LGLLANLSGNLKALTAAVHVNREVPGDALMRLSGSVDAFGVPALTDRIEPMSILTAISVTSPIGLYGLGLVSSHKGLAFLNDIQRGLGERLLNVEQLAGGLQFLPRATGLIQFIG
jgi:hypothetical protein